MFKNLLIGAAVVASTLFAIAPEAKADTYGYGSNYFDICNEADISVSFKTDETFVTHVLQPGECDTIWTDWNYIIVDYDDSDAYGWQNYSVRVEYPNDLSFYTFSEGYETIIDHYYW